MSDSSNENHHRGHVAAVVRGNIWSVAIGAALLCYYGFAHLLEPEGSTLFARSNWLFFHAVRLGGLALGVLAIWCCLGRASALAVDGVVSVLIGVSFLLSGGGMLMDGGAGLNTILIIVFGLMFFRSGRHNWQTYRHLAGGGGVVTEVYAETFQPPAPPAAATARAPGPVVAASVPQVERASIPDHAPPQQANGQEVEAPPEGFLAAMAKKPPPSEP